MDRTKSLEELENDIWPSYEFETSLVSTCHRLRKLPLTSLSVGDLRILIGQGIGLPHLVPIALEMLERNPLVEGDCYPGDLLSNVISQARWFESHRILHKRLLKVAKRALAKRLDKHLTLALQEFVRPRTS